MTREIEKQGIKNLIFLYLGIGIGLFNTLLRTRALSPEEIGLISILMSFSTFAGFIIAFGMPSGILKFYSLYKRNSGQKAALIGFGFLVVFVLFLVVSGIFFLIKDFIVLKYDNALLGRYINYIYFLFLFNSLSIIFDTIFRSEYLTVKSNIIKTFIEKALNFVFLGLMLLVDFSFHIFFLCTVSIQAFKVILYVLYTKKDIKLSRPDFSVLNRSFFRRFFSYTLYMLCAGITGIVTTVADRIMLGYYADLTIVGIYSIIMVFSNLMAMVGSGFGMIATPMIAEYWNDRNTDGIQETYSDNTNVLIFLGAFLFVLIALFGRKILAFLGESYAVGYWAMIFLLIGQLINLFTGLCGSIIALSKYYRFDFYVRFLLAFLAVSTNVIFIPMWGLLGAAFATSLSLAVYNIVKLIYAYIKFGMQPYNHDTIISLLYVSIFGVCLYFINRLIDLNNIVLILAACVLFFAVYGLAGVYLLKLKPAVLLWTPVLEALQKRMSR